MELPTGSAAAVTLLIRQSINTVRSGFIAIAMELPFFGNVLPVHDLSFGWDHISVRRIHRATRDKPLGVPQSSAVVEPHEGGRAVEVHEDAQTSDRLEGLHPEDIEVPPVFV